MKVSLKKQSGYTLYEQFTSLESNQQWDNLKKLFKDIMIKELKMDLDCLNFLTRIVGYDGSLTASWLSLIQDAANILCLYQKQLNINQLHNNLLKQVARVVSLQNSKNYKCLIAIFKLQSMVMNELPKDQNENPQIESNMKFVFRYLFIGIPKFQIQLFPNGMQLDNSTSGNSELSSDPDDYPSKQFTDKLFNKLRSQALLVTQTMIRQFPKSLLQNWQMYLKPSQQSNFDVSFNEPSLLSLLLYENQKKAKINIISTLIISLDILQIAKWIYGHEFHRQVHANKSFQPKAYQFFQAAKNIHFTVMHLLHHSTDLQFLSMLFKLQQVVINSTLILEKLPEEQGVIPYCDKFILPIFQMKWLDESHSDQVQQVLNVKMNAIQTFNNILKSDTKFDQLGEQYFKKHNILHLKIFETKIQENDTVHTLCYQELNAIYQNMQKHYQNYFFETNILGSIYQPTLQGFKLMEEICHFMNDDEFGSEIYPIVNVMLKQDYSKHSDFMQVQLHILCDLKENFWSKYPMEYDIIKYLERMFEKIFKELNISSLKISFFKCIGSLSCLPNFYGSKEIVEKIIKFFKVDNVSNIHVLEKLSWSVANICSNIEIEENKLILEQLIRFSNHSKEKVSVNGVRGLGHFLRKAKKIEKQDEIINSIVKGLKNKNPKIQWNSSFCLNNIYQGELNDLKEMIIQNNDVQESILDILRQRVNLKSQIHCVELVIIMEIKQKKMIQELLNLVRDLGQQSDFIEEKLKMKLRQLLMQVLEQQLQDYHEMDDIIFRRIIEEEYELILWEVKQSDIQFDISWIRGDLSLQDVEEQFESRLTDQKAMMQQQESDIPVYKYIRISQINNQLSQVFKRCQKISQQAIEIMEKKQDNVSFAVHQAHEEMIKSEIKEKDMIIRLQIEE